MTLAGLMRALAFLEREYADPTDERTIRDRLLAYIDGRTHRAAIVDPLPADAPAGYLMVKAGDPFLYVGRGPGNRLARTPLELVP